jgi:hypothetical protein
MRIGGKGAKLNAVTPAKAGVQKYLNEIDSGSRLKTCRDKFRRNGRKTYFLPFYDSSILGALYLIPHSAIRIPNFFELPLTDRRQGDKNQIG